MNKIEPINGANLLIIYLLAQVSESYNHHKNNCDEITNDS